MCQMKDIRDLEQDVRSFVRRDFSPQFGRLAERFPSDPSWARLRQLGTELWLDTGSLADARRLWTRELAALTTNNTLLNREVQTGTYDSLIGEAARLLAPYRLSQQQLKLEIAFILNCVHGLKLVQQFDAFVSVEEHTDLAHDLPAAVACARRYHQVCPERFIIKIPLTPAGLLATRKAAREGVRINHTLGFSARQNYTIARIGRPDYVNVFLGRLNSFVADNGLGSGAYVGERATLASQRAIRQLRGTHGVGSRQIGASFRAGEQVADLAGIDVMTMPPKVAEQFLQMGLQPEQLTDRTGQDYRPPLADRIDPQAVRLDTLWDVEPVVTTCMDALASENLDSFTPDDLVDFFARHGCGDLLVRWSTDQIAASAAEGKIPKLAHWSDALADRAIGLDSLMNLAGLNSFAADQQQMDSRVSGQVQKAGAVAE